MIAAASSFVVGLLLGMFIFARAWRPTFVRAAALAYWFIGDQSVGGDIARKLYKDLAFVPPELRDLEIKEA